MKAPALGMMADTISSNSLDIVREIRPNIVGCLVIFIENMGEGHGNLGVAFNGALDKEEIKEILARASKEFDTAKFVNVIKK